MFENTSDSQTYESLAWKLNLEMRHAVLPVTFFVGIEAIVGFIGNLFVLYVFCYRYQVCNFRYFVLCLAFTDFISTLSTMPGEVVTQLYWYVYPVPLLCKIKSFFNVFTVSAEALCLFTIAVDRYRKVCTPFGRQIKPLTAKLLCFLIYFLAFILALPVAILWGTNVHWKIYEGRRIQVTVCEKDKYFVNSKYPVLYVISVQTIVVTCLICMLVLYIFVARKLISCKSNKHSSQVSVMAFSLTNGTIATSRGDQGDQIEQEELSVHEFPTSSESPRPCPHLETRNKAVQTCPNQETEMQISVKTSNVKPGESMVPRRLRQNFVTSPVRQRSADAARVRRKTLIMFILTVVFILTTTLYLTLLANIARSDDVLQEMSDSGKVAYFFFFRLVFINHVINPFIYGFLDSQFINGIRELQKNVLSLYRVRVRPDRPTD